MRNSVSLSVHFLLRPKSDVKIKKTSDTASGKMKLIPLIFSIFISVEVKCNERNNFPPKFHPHNSGMLTSDGSIYLPPETQSTMQYLPVKSDNNLQYPYLPITGTKAPLMFPTPFPLMFSSTTRTDNDDDDENIKPNDKQPSQFMRNNRTSRSQFDQSERNSFKPTPNYNQPIDRIDKKMPYGFVNSNPNPVIQKATPRSMVISEPQRSDMYDQYKGAAAYHGPSYLPAPGAPGVYISSTTETSVPIIRLSNEMDLDGSFSYEALGADQTHYVQHSRMENSGTDKEEQVVEGSYSYVGDNGQTYTVHYIADSKGFRASGDHLPVAPPVPEIIQRAVQFNLAEEAKKPPNLKSWHSDENDVSESERYQSFITPPSRPLFTGRPPQSFSFGFGQGATNPANNLVPAASTQSQININNGFSLDKMKSPNNGGPISPQVTFLASQGAHNPSMNSQPSIVRSIMTEKPTLPQLINYDAAAKESNEESNKALWRWQYGLNPNMNQTPEKNSISRSSAEGDNVIINFSDMTPEQYSKMIQTELEPKIQSTTFDQVAENNLIKTYQLPQDNNFHIQNKEIDQTYKLKNSKIETTENLKTPYYSNDAKNLNVNNVDTKSTDTMVNARSKLLTQNDFIPHSQTVTQSYDYEDISYEPRRVAKSSTSEPHIFSTPNYNTVNNKYGYEAQRTEWSKGFNNQIEKIQMSSTTESPKTTTENEVSFTDFIVHEDQNVFKPSQPVYYTEIQQKEDTTTAETSFENIINENIFLKSLFNSKKNDQHDANRIKEESNKYHHQKINAEHKKPDKHLKIIQMPAKSPNDIKPIKKSMEIADIMNYLSAKNNFESVKVKPKSKYIANNYSQRSEVHYIPMQHENLHYDNENDEEEDLEYDASNHRPTYYHPKELQGIIKNYKVLQRNNSAFNSGHDVEQLRRNLSPPPAKMSNLPPLGRAGPSMKSYLPPIYV